jgi:hypothetical protein
MQQKNYSMTHLHMLLTECMTRTCDETDLYESPDEILRHIRTCARFQLELLCAQLEKLDPLTEHKSYNMVKALSDRVYNLWEFCDECTSYERK